MKDLTQEAPRSPRLRIKNLVILGRTLDKGRAKINGKLGEFHFDCPLDNMLFGFFGVNGTDVYALLEKGAGDEEVAQWIIEHATQKHSAQEIADWSDTTESFNPIQIPEKKEWFEGACKELGLDPQHTSLFDMLEEDDRQSFQANPKAASCCSL